MQLRLLIPCLLLSSQLMAGTITPQMVCPNITTEGQSILSKIQTLKDQIKSGPECQSLKDKLAVVNEVVANDDWKTFKNVVTGSNSESLEGDQIDTLRELTEKVSYSLTETIASITGNNNCVDEKDKPSFLSSISGVTKEVSDLVGNSTGPYGMAVSVGGNILSGAIKGIDDFFQNRRKYSFNPNNKEEEILFMNQFCSFAEIQRDVNDMNNLETRLEDLDKLTEYLKLKEEVLIGNDSSGKVACELCIAYRLAWKAQASGKKLIFDITRDANIDYSDLTQINPGKIIRCNQMSQAFHSTDSSLDKFYNLLTKYENPMMSPTDKDVLEESLAMGEVYKNKFKRGRDCAQQDQEDIYSLSRQFNNTLRDEILPLNETIFGQQYAYFRSEADKKYYDPLGSYIATTLERQKWVIKERKNIVAKLKNDYNRTSDLSHINTDHAYLQRNIIDKQLPVYINYLVRKNLSLYQHFQRSLEKFIKIKVGGIQSRRMRRDSYKPGEYTNYFEKPVHTIPNLIDQIMAAHVPIKPEDENTEEEENSALTTLNQTGSYEDRVNSLQERLIGNSAHFARTYYSQQKRVIKQLDDAIIKSEVIFQYCEYAEYISHKVASVDRACKNSVKRILAALSALKPHYETLEKMQEFDRWIIKTLKVQSTAIADFSAKIKKWNAQGDDRFLLAGEERKKPKTVSENIEAEKEELDETKLFKLKIE